MNNKTFIITAIVLILIQIGICTWLYKNTPPPVIERTDTITKIEFDTIETVRDTTITKFIPKEIEKIRTDTIKDTVLVTERKTYIDTLCNDKDSIILKSTISGINTRIDSLQAEWKKQKEIITQTITVTKYIEKPKTFKDHFSLGVGMGYGYGLNNKQFEPFIGVSFNYNLGF